MSTKILLSTSATHLPELFRIGGQKKIINICNLHLFHCLQNYLFFFIAIIVVLVVVLIIIIINCENVKIIKMKKKKSKKKHTQLFHDNKLLNVYEKYYKIDFLLHLPAC